MEEEEKDEELGGGDEVWSWGAGTEGQLGTGSVEDQQVPQLLQPPLPIISQLACGGAHAIALTRCGKVQTWGWGTCGQLGHGDLMNVLQPKPVMSLESFVICYVSAGWNHSGFVSDTGCLFTCGDGSFGQLGHGDYLSHSSPVEVSSFVLMNVDQIACGMRHSLVLLKGSSGDSVYGFGSGRRGQLGISTDQIRKSFNLPQVTNGFENFEIVTISANGDHSSALAADGRLYTWGRGFNSMPDAYVPQLVPSPLKFSGLALGWNHALVLTDDGELLMLGGSHHGMLSSPQNEELKQQEPVHCEPCPSSDVCRAPALNKVAGLDGIKVAAVAAGAEHSALVTENGIIMTWGWGEHGQLGLGGTCDQTTPQMVNLGDTGSNVHATFNIYCGSGFTFAVRKVCIESMVDHSVRLET